MRWRFLDDTSTPFGFAHQGGDETAPGNTLASFGHAVSLGYRYIETDVQVTSDGVLVIYHDDDLEAGTGVAGRIDDMTWPEVAELRVGDGHSLARFDDVVERFPDVRFNIEPKTDRSVGALVESIERLDLADRVCIGSFDDRRLRRARKALGPDVCMSPGPIGVGIVLLAALVWPRWRSPFGALQLPPKVWILPLAHPWLVGRLHRMGLQVHIWTINTAEEMGELLDAGVDAIMTDKVSILRDVLQARDEWS